MAGVIVGTRAGLYGLGDLEGEEWGGHSITWLQRGGDAWWAIVDGRRVFRYQPGSKGEAVIEMTGLRANCLLPTDSSLLVGAEEAALFEYDGEQTVRRKDFDDAPGRDSWFTPWGGPPDVRSMGRDLDGSIYLNVHVGGVLVYRDSDPVWRDTMDIHADVHQVVAHPARAGVAVVASARGLGVTIDGAGTWSFLSKGMHGDYCRAVAVTGETVFLSAALGSQGRDAAVYRTDLTGSSFDKLTAGLPPWFSTNVNTGCLDAMGDTVAIGDADGTVYLSRDAGATFEKLAAGLPPLICLGLAG
jgi:hypothetical protein